MLANRSASFKLAHILCNRKITILKLIFSGGPYAAFAGRDASRGLATFNVTPSEQEYDDLSDLNSQEMESIREWEEQFKGWRSIPTKFASIMFNLD